MKPKTIPIVVPPISIHGTQTNKSTPVKVPSHPHYTKPPTQETPITHTQSVPITVAHKPIDTKIQPLTQPITPQLPEKGTKLSPIPKPPSRNNQTPDLPIVPPTPIKTNQPNIQTEQCMDAE